MKVTIGQNSKMG